MIGWYEETGTIVVQVVNLNTMQVTSFAGFPRWVFDNPGVRMEKRRITLIKSKQFREAGPDAPREIFFETGTIFEVEQIDCILDYKGRRKKKKKGRRGGRENEIEKKKKKKKKKNSTIDILHGNSNLLQRR